MKATAGEVYTVYNQYLNTETDRTTSGRCCPGYPIRVRLSKSG